MIKVSLTESRRKLWRSAFLWLLFLAPFFFLTYGRMNQHTASLTDVGSIVFDWEKTIPFWPWTIVPYWSIDLLYGLSLFICTSRRELNVHVARLISATLVACIGFWLFPLQFSFTRPISEGVFGWLFQQLEMFDLPFNQAPSLHIILLWLLWLRYCAHTPPRWHWLLHGWFTLIGVSVLTTWQHHFIDVVTGFAAGVLISYLLPIHFQWHWRYSSDPRRIKLAKRYYSGAIVCMVIGWWLGGLGWILLWPAICLLTIGLGYTGLGVNVFQKNRQGKMSPSARILLAPYQLGSWCSFSYFHRKTTLMDEIAPGIFLGSFPRVELNSMAVLDMTSDWPRSRFTYSGGYIACPRLDLVAPTVEELDESVVALELLLKESNVLVHCALGLSRSAIVVVAWLLKQGAAESVERAIDIVRSSRPGIIIHEGHRDTLEQWFKQYSREVSDA